MKEEGRRFGYVKCLWCRDGVPGVVPYPRPLGRTPAGLRVDREDPEGTCVDEKRCTRSPP